MPRLARRASMSRGTRVRRAGEAPPPLSAALGEVSAGCADAAPDGVAAPSLHSSRAWLGEVREGREVGDLEVGGGLGWGGGAGAGAAGAAVDPDARPAELAGWGDVVVE